MKAKIMSWLIRHHFLVMRCEACGTEFDAKDYESLCWLAEGHRQFCPKAEVPR